MVDLLLSLLALNVHLLRSVVRSVFTLLAPTLSPQAVMHVFQVRAEMRAGDAMLLPVRRSGDPVAKMLADKFQVAFVILMPMPEIGHFRSMNLIKFAFSKDFQLIFFARRWKSLSSLSYERFWWKHRVTDTCPPPKVYL